MQINTFLVRKMEDIDAASWNSLAGAEYPFLRHEFLLALEKEACLGSGVGWMPYHGIVEDQDGQLLAASPGYLKSNSFGEFVFDWMFADAYARSGMDYYPKLVIASPFTPTTGPRLLIRPDLCRAEFSEILIRLGIETTQMLRLSSLHWLFISDDELLESPDVLLRKGYQFHWENPGVHSFDEYLEYFTSKRRKEIRRERRMVQDAGVYIERIRGDQVDPALWDDVYELYTLTFARHNNYPAMSRSFFHKIAETMGDKILLVTAMRGQELMAMAYFLIGTDCLYGRYWGTIEDIPALHFEICYYQGLEYCLEKGLHRFEPGAQGEHKITRGFLPTPTWSAHWIANPVFRDMIAEYLGRENILVDRQMSELRKHSPFKST